MFSYGSGLASSLFILKVQGDIFKIKKELNIHERMANRIKISPTEFEEIMDKREKAYGNLPTTPSVINQKDISYY